MPHLFDPLTIRGTTFRNRIGVSPMCQYSSINGCATDWHLVHLGSRAIGGAGLVVMEATAVEARGRITPSDNGLWNDEQIPQLARITAFVKEHGAVAGIQLAHAGRKASTAAPWHGGHVLTDEEGGWDVVGPSALPFSETFRHPHALSKAEIKGIESAFIAATKRALAARFNFIELHAAHGYLLHSFLSPLSDKRNDEYGGTFENRIRFLMETTSAMRTVWPTELPFAVRLSCSDWVEGGWTLEESVDLSRRLKKEGVDIIDCSSGGLTPSAQIPVGAGYQIPFSETIRKGAGIDTAAVGMIVDPMQADEIIRNGRADLVFLARELLRDPYWPLHAAKAVHKTGPVPVQYQRAF